MTVTVRRILANPVRTTGETWKFITDLICACDDSKRTQLNEASNIAAMLIAEEHARSAPIILTGFEPQVRIYTLHGEAAIDGAKAKEESLLVTASDVWVVSLPAEGVDFKFASQALSNLSHITVYDLSKKKSPTNHIKTKTVTEPVTVNFTVLED